MVNNHLGIPVPQHVPKCATDDSITVPDLFSLQGKVASVTGGSQGIGLAVVEAFAQAGADIAIWYNSTNPEKEAEAIASKYNVKVKTYQAHITNWDAVEKTVEQQVKDFGKIDIFVANAGVTWQGGPMIDTPDHSEYEKVVGVDQTSVYYCAKAIGRVFRKQGSGSLILTSSISAKIVNVPQMQAVYNAAKAAVTQLGKSLAIEWAGFARVNIISPGYISTNMLSFASDENMSRWCSYTPMARPGVPKELAGAFLYFASDASTYTTGSDLVIDGGYTLF